MASLYEEITSLEQESGLIAVEEDELPTQITISMENEPYPQQIPVSKDLDHDGPHEMDAAPSQTTESLQQDFTPEQIEPAPIESSEEENVSVQESIILEAMPSPAHDESTLPPAISFQPPNDIPPLEPSPEPVIGSLISESRAPLADPNELKEALKVLEQALKEAKTNRASSAPVKLFKAGNVPAPLVVLAHERELRTRLEYAARGEPKGLVIQTEIDAISADLLSISNAVNADRSAGKAKVAANRASEVDSLRTRVQAVEIQVYSDPKEVRIARAKALEEEIVAVKRALSAHTARPKTAPVVKKETTITPTVTSTARAPPPTKVTSPPKAAKAAPARPVSAPPTRKPATAPPQSSPPRATGNRPASAPPRKKLEARVPVPPPPQLSSPPRSARSTAASSKVSSAFASRTVAHPSMADTRDVPPPGSYDSSNRDSIASKAHLKKPSPSMVSKSPRKSVDQLEFRGKDAPPPGAYEMTHLSLGKGARSTNFGAHSTRSSINEGFKGLESPGPGAYADSSFSDSLSARVAKGKTASAVFRTTEPRFAKLAKSDAPDIVYDIDHAIKSPKSPMAIFSSKLPAHQSLAKVSEAPPPGTYETSRKGTIADNMGKTKLGTNAFTSTKRWHEQKERAPPVGSYDIKVPTATTKGPNMSKGIDRSGASKTVFVADQHRRMVKSLPVPKTQTSSA